MMSRNFQPWAVLPLLVIATAFILSFLCVFAGNKPGYMEGYHVFTLNATRFGQNAVEKIDEKVMGLNLSKILKRPDLPAEPVSVSATLTIPPASITLAPRNPDKLDDFVENLTGKIASVNSDAGDFIGGAITSVKSGIESKATAIASAVESKASSIEGVIASKISSAIASAQTAIVEQVNETYTDVLSSLDLQGFYSIHMLTTCSGDYKTPQGMNITVGASPFPPNGTQKVVETCGKHSSLNPLTLVRLLFEIAIVSTGICLLTSIWAVIFFSRKKAIINVIVSLPALGFLALASAATHGIATAASAVINFLGEEVGLKAHAGQSFITLVWATTILVLVNACLWTSLCFTAEHLPSLSKLYGSKSGTYVDDGFVAHELKIVHPGEPGYERGPTGHSDVAAWAAAGAHRGPSRGSAYAQSDEARRYAKKNSWFVRGNHA